MYMPCSYEAGVRICFRYISLSLSLFFILQTKSVTFLSTTTSTAISKKTAENRTKRIEAFCMNHQKKVKRFSGKLFWIGNFVWIKWLNNNKIKSLRQNDEYPFAFVHVIDCDYWKFPFAYEISVFCIWIERECSNLLILSPFSSFIFLLFLLPAVNFCQVHTVIIFISMLLNNCWHWW